MVVGDVAAARPGPGETLGGSEGGGDGSVERSARDVVREKGEGEETRRAGLGDGSVGGKEK